MFCDESSEPFNVSVIRSYHDNNECYQVLEKVGSDELFWLFMAVDSCEGISGGILEALKKHLLEILVKERLSVQERGLTVSRMLDVLVNAPEEE